jgi:hypothetical protein
LGGGCRTFPAKEEANQEGRNQNSGALRVRIGDSLRKSLLKRQCVHNIINILISTTISLMTRDIIVKFPTILLKEMYNLQPPPSPSPPDVSLPVLPLVL